MIFLLIFIVQNSDPVQVQYFGLQGTLPLGVAMLFAAIAGALTAACSAPSGSCNCGLAPGAPPPAEPGPPSRPLRPPARVRTTPPRGPS